jgi:cytoskeletal protein CcmA (bactofilin family)
MPLVSLFRIVLLCGYVMTVASPAPASAETSETGNTYLAGSDIRIGNPVDGDLLAAGGRVSVEQPVADDAAVAGGAVDIRAPVRQDLRVAGGTVNIDQDVGADLMAAGGKVRIDPAAGIGGSAWLAGGDVRVDGRIGRNAKIYGNKITLAGEIAGDARLAGEQIVVMPTARIDGNLSYASPEALPESLRSQVGGSITRMEGPQGWKTPSRHTGIGLSWFHPIFIVSMLLCGMLLYLFFPNAVLGIEEAIGRHPVQSLLTGVALLFAIPPLAILLMATVIGLPIGFALLLLYPLALLLGYLATAFFVGGRFATAMKKTGRLSTKQQALFLLLALFTLGIALALPFLGGFIFILAVVTGIGGFAVWMQMKRKAAQAVQPGQEQLAP